MLANLADVPTDDLAKWNYLPYYNSQAVTAASCSYTDCKGLTPYNYDYFRIGLFYFDLTQFKYDCSVSENCDEAAYVDFDGRAVGFYGHTYVDDSGSTLYDQGFCFSADRNCVMLYNASGSYSLISITANEAPDASYPTASEFDSAIDLGLYGFSTT